MRESINHTFTGPKEMFPYAPMTDVVVRNFDHEKWVSTKFLFLNACEMRYECLNPDKQSIIRFTRFNYCLPMSTHGHLLGTTLSEHEKICPRCGKPESLCPYNMFEDRQPVLVRDTDNEKWFLRAFYKSDGLNTHRLNCVYTVDYELSTDIITGAAWKQCIDYEKNKHLLCTNSSKGIVI